MINKSTLFSPKRKGLIIGFGALCLSGVAAAVIFIQGPTSLSAQNTALAASLSGFKPNAEVEYAVIVAGEHDVAGKVLVDQTGIADIPAHSLAKGRRESAITYNIRINDENDPLAVNFKLEPGSGKITASGNGVREFSEIIIEEIGGAAVGGRYKIKADWAGFFTQDKSSDFDISRPGQEYQLALYDVIESDAQAEAPHIIKVYSAPGGGAKDQSKVNEFTATLCNGDYPLSFCQESIVEQQNQMIVDNYVKAFMLMAEQFSAVMMQQMYVIGTFFDAKQQLETQQELMALQAEAIKDYHPSEQMCRFGSFVKSVAQTEEKAIFDKLALNEILMSSYQNAVNGSTSEGFAVDIESRIRQFRKVYCNPTDNSNGLAYMCDHDQDGNPATDATGAADPERMNIDIDFARSVDSKMTLNVDFSNDATSETEEDIIALGRNLYWPAALPNAAEEALPNFYSEYMSARRIMAIENVAHNSFAEIVGLKSKMNPTQNVPSGTAFMKSLMREFGLNDAEIDDIMGEYPSYYAQMEVLTKKIYQAPDFYTNLYDKPTNIDRIGASMDAIKLMQSRDHYEAALRREMLTSMMVEEALSKHYDLVNGQLINEASKF